MFLAPPYFESDKRMKEIMVKQEIRRTLNIKLLQNKHFGTFEEKMTSIIRCVDSFLNRLDDSER